MSCLEKIRPSGAAFPGSITMPASGFRKLDARPQPPCLNHHILTCLSSLRLFVNSPNHRSRSTVTQLCRFLLHIMHGPVVRNLSPVGHSHTIEPQVEITTGRSVPLPSKHARSLTAACYSSAFRTMVSFHTIALSV